MVDEYQVTYEYSAGSSITFKTYNLKINYTRPGLRVDTRVDGVKVVTDPGFVQRIFTCTALIPGATMLTLNTVQTGAIVYTGAYPRITLIYFTGTDTIANVEVALTNLEVVDQGPSGWTVALTLTEKNQ